MGNMRILLTTLFAIMIEAKCAVAKEILFSDKAVLMSE